MATPATPHSANPASPPIVAGQQQSQPIDIQQIENNPIHVDLEQNQSVRLGIFARLPSGKRILIKEVTGTDLEKVWSTFKTERGIPPTSSEVRIDLTNSRFEYQTADKEATKGLLYKEDLAPFYRVISTLTVPRKEGSKIEETPLSAILRLPTHTKGHRAHSKAKPGLQKDDPRLQNLQCGEKEVAEVLNQQPLTEEGLAEKMKILKRKKGARLLVEKYEAELESMKEQAAQQKSFAGQHSENRLALVSEKPIDSAAIGFNALHPFPKVGNPEEFFQALNAQFQAAKAFIQGQPIPGVDHFTDGFSVRPKWPPIEYSSQKPIDAKKEDAYAKELVLAGLPEQLILPNGQFDHRQIYEAALEQFELEPTRDPREVFFIRLAEKIAENDLAGAEAVITGTSSEILLDGLEAGEQKAIRDSLWAYSQEIMSIFQSPTLGGAVGNTETLASFRDADKTAKARWMDLAADTAHAIGLSGNNYKPTPEKLIAGFVAEVEEIQKQKRNENSQTHPFATPLSRERNIDIHKETQQAIEQGHYSTRLGREIGIDQTALEAMKANTHTYTLPDPAQRTPLGDPKEGEISVKNQTTLQAVQEMHKKGVEPFVLALGNGEIPGGGLKKGANTHEATLCRQSTLLHGSVQSKADLYPIPEKAGLVVPSVQFFRDDPQNGYDFLEQDPDSNPLLATCFICAPYDLAKAEVLKQVNENREIYTQGTKDKIRAYLEYALENGLQHLIIDPSGFADFGNSPQTIARCFKEVLAESRYQNAFDETIFSVVDNPSNPGYFNIFHQTLVGLPA